LAKEAADKAAKAEAGAEEEEEEEL